MADIERLLLNDKNIFPTEDLIFSVIGDKMILWNEILDHVHDNYDSISGEWRYYNDGKQWLFKLTKKKNTIFWAAIMKESFRITFYFGDKAAQAIDTCNLPESVKEVFRTARKSGKIRPVSLKINTKEDVETVKSLISVKVKG